MICFVQIEYFVKILLSFGIWCESCASPYQSLLNHLWGSAIVSQWFCKGNWSSVMVRWCFYQALWGSTIFLKLFCNKSSFDIHTHITNYKYHQNFIIYVIWSKCIEEVTVFEVWWGIHNGSARFIKVLQWSHDGSPNGYWGSTSGSWEVCQRFVKGPHEVYEKFSRVCVRSAKGLRNLS